MKITITTVSAIILAVSFLGCSEPLTTREKGAVYGTLGGAGAGIGAAVGLLGGALIGDQVQARQKQDDEIQRRLQAQQAEIDRQQRELDRLKSQQAR